MPSSIKFKDNTPEKMKDDFMRALNDPNLSAELFMSVKGLAVDCHMNGNAPSFFRLFTALFSQAPELMPIVEDVLKLIKENPESIHIMKKE